MAQHINPHKIRIVPRDGELEITLNINISVDGQLSASSQQAEVLPVINEEEPAEPLLPDFMSGVSVDFGKKEK
jgi:hypothetical protein